MRIKQSSFLFSCHLKASSVINTGDYSEVYANVWWMWCSVPIKICCHAAQTTGIHNHCVTESSGFLEPHLSKALAVNQIWRDDIWTRGQCGVNIQPQDNPDLWSGVMAQSRHQADGPRGLGQVTRSWYWANTEIKIKYEMLSFRKK